MLNPRSLSVFALAASLSASAHAQYGVTVSGNWSSLTFDDANSSEFNDLFDIDPDARISGLGISGPLVFDNGLRIQDPIDPEFAFDFFSIITTTLSSGVKTTRYFEPSIDGFCVEIMFDNGQSIEIEGDPTVTLELFDQIELGGDGPIFGFVDFGRTSVAFSNDDLVDAGMSDPSYTGGLNVLYGAFYEEFTFHEAPSSVQIDWVDWGEYNFTEGTLFMGETNNFNNTFFDSVGPTEGTMSLADLLAAICPEDFDGNGAVDIDDLLRCLGAFGNSADGDTDGDGDTDIDDLLRVLGEFGSACP